MSSLLSSNVSTIFDGSIALGFLLGLVLVFAVQIEIARYLPGERTQRLSGTILIGLIPLLTATSMVIVLKIAQILSAS